VIRKLLPSVSFTVFRVSQEQEIKIATPPKKLHKQKISVNERAILSQYFNDAAPTAKLFSAEKNGRLFIAYGV
jgi:hypothetical protein